MNTELFRSGFVAVVGRPNVGKSTLVNALMDEKVTIVSKTPNTTRNQVRGILSGEDFQVIFVDTPGVHKPRTPLGARLNNSATSALEDADLVVVVVDATAATGPGDERVLKSAPEGSFLVLNKIDRSNPKAIFERLSTLSQYSMDEYFPISASKGLGVEQLRNAIIARMPLGPMYYPSGTTSDRTETEWIAELVREALLATLREELPHSIATAVTEVEGKYLRCEIFVERDSQKGIVLGKGGENLKQIGTLVRQSMPKGMYLDLVVKVAKDWQSTSRFLDELGI